MRCTPIFAVLVIMFGVGSALGQDVGWPPAPVETTGQTVAYLTGDDGDLEIGIRWPAPRFNDNGDGTVTDFLTGLIWMKQIDCLGDQWWNMIMISIGLLNDGSVTCTGYAAGTYGDWRAPNIKEYLSLVSYGKSSPALPDGHPFLSSDYALSLWTSTTFAGDTLMKWYVNFGTGGVGVDGVTDQMIGVWPVRGGPIFADGFGPGDTRMWSAGVQ